MDADYDILTEITEVIYNKLQSDSIDYSSLKLKKQPLKLIEKKIRLILIIFTLIQNKFIEE